jgi:DNA-binding transcriptional ArsR family regulator
VDTKPDEMKGSVDKGSPEFAHVQLLKALANPVRLHLLGILSYRDISPAEFARERREPVSNVAYHFRALEKLGCVEVVDTRPVRGSTEHFFRRTEIVVYDDDSFLYMPDEARQIVASSIIRDLVGRMTKALLAGTFTAREDFHITWTPVKLDEQGWTEVISILATAFQKVGDVEVRAAERMAESGEDGLVATVALAGFESPRE